MEGRPALLVPVWSGAAAGIAFGSAAAGWLAAVQRLGQHERHGRRWTAERPLLEAEPEPVEGAAAAGPEGERQAGSEPEEEEARRRDEDVNMQR